jgi:hypothetical protein
VLAGGFAAALAALVRARVLDWAPKSHRKARLRTLADRRSVTHTHAVLRRAEQKQEQRFQQRLRITMMALIAAILLHAHS